MGLTYKNEILPYKVEENTDAESLSHYDFFYNDFSKQQEKNNSFTIKYKDSILKGSDNQFETIMLELLPDIIIELVKQDFYRYYKRVFKGEISAKLVYTGSYISRFDLISIEIDLTQQELDLIIKTFGL